jgi:glycosyltransferase involved in cell wall biosynthesis
MRILILSQYYPPETGAPQNRLSDLSHRLQRLGHTVVILTALPNYPQGKIFEQYRHRIVLEEWTRGVRIIRTWIYATKKKQFLLRLLNYWSFVLFSFLIGILKVSRQDVVIVESPPLFLGFSGFLLSRCIGAKLVFNVSDLWPESAVAMGVLRNKVLIDLSRRLEEFVYRHSDMITGQTQGIVDSVQSRFPAKHVQLITNGVDVDAFRSGSHADHKAKAKREFGIDGKFVIGYAGLHGLAQGLETVLQAAQRLSRYQELLFVLFGDGPERERLVQFARQNRLANVRFYPPQHSSRMPIVTASFDIGIIPLRRLELFKGALPSKMFEAMAAAIPLVVSVEGEASALVMKAQSGICVEPENPDAMANAILALYRDPATRCALGQNGRQYVVEHYDREHIAAKFERSILRLHVAGQT